MGKTGSQCEPKIPVLVKISALAMYLFVCIHIYPYGIILDNTTYYEEYR